LADDVLVTSIERKSAWILAGIAALEGSWVAVNLALGGRRFIAFLGYGSGRAGTAAGWATASAVTLLFVLAAWRLPSVRQNMLALTWLKLLALAVAVSAGILEEVVFRKLLMDHLAAIGLGVALQIVISGLAFGAAHGVWGLMAKSVRTALGATIATGAMGAGLAIVYVAAGRSVAPCIAAHFLINALLEPGLVLAATRGEMGRPATSRFAERDRGVDVRNGKLRNGRR
jgi:membrane protease YdiL (CAAX protease family)